MVERGASGVEGSKAGPTAEWSNFEMRMRHRRAKRCVQRARAAIEAGRLDEAAAALDEARGLDASTAGLDEASGQLLLLQNPAVPEVRRSRLRIALVACGLLAAAGYGGWRVASLREPTPPVQVQAAAPAPKPEARSVSLKVEEIRLSDETAIDAEPAPELAASQAEAQPQVADETPRPAATTGNPVTELASLPRDVAPPAPIRMTSPPGLSDGPPPAVPSPVAELGPAPSPAPAVPALDVVPAPEPARPSVVVTDERAAVRAALARYESAYSRLDTSAAHAVWPEVDERALARAFDGLASQRVSLGACDVNLRGGAARASCAGSATWTPKVGGGTRTSSRKWTFDLRQADGGWKIVRVDSR